MGAASLLASARCACCRPPVTMRTERLPEAVCAAKFGLSCTRILKSTAPSNAVPRARAALAAGLFFAPLPLAACCGPAAAGFRMVSDLQGVAGSQMQLGASWQVGVG